MNTVKFKKTIILLAIVILIIGIILIVIALSNNKQNSTNKFTNSEISYEQIAEDNTLDEYNIEEFDFLLASNCIQSYISGINQNNSKYYGTDENGNYKIVVEQEEINKNAYNFLSSEYIEKNNITTQNVYNYVPKVTQDFLFVPINMKAKNTEQIKTFKVSGFVTDLNYNFINYLYVLINLDIENRTFSIEPITNDTYESNDIQNNNVRIQENENNKYSFSQYTSDTVIKQYFKNYKAMMLSNPEIAYLCLDEEYRNKSFTNVESFKKYVNDNKEKYLKINPSAYNTKTISDKNYNEKIIVDQDGHYYIFNTSLANASQFNVMLDTYVIGTSEFNETYLKQKDENKVVLNINRFLYAINDKNPYAYNVLDNTFKENNFNTYEEFETYAKNNFYEYNELAADYDLEKEGNYYIYKTQIRSGQGIAVDTKNITIIMELKENTDFVMSFNMD